MVWKEQLKGYLAAMGWTALRCAGRKPETPRIVVIMYHSIGHTGTSLDPVRFDEQLALLSELIPTNVLVRDVANLQKPIERWTVCLTFDDGYADNHEIVLSLLKKHSFQATFFVCTGFVNGECDITRRFRHYRDLQPMTWAQVTELAAEGMEIGAHTHTHSLLSSLCTKMQHEEMQHSKKLIEDRLCQTVHSFAIPFGNLGTYTRETLNLAAKNFDVCCTTRFSTNPPFPSRYLGMVLLDRVEPKPHDTLVTFRNKIQGRWDAMKHLQRARRWPMR